MTRATKAELLDLAAQTEAAPAETQGVMLLQVLDALRLPDRPLHFRIVRMIEVGAYESAALTLVPEGWGYELRRGHSVERRALCRMWNGHGTWTDGTLAATPALALTTAALRAQAEEADE